LKLNLLSLDQVPKAAKLLVKNSLGVSTGSDEFVLNRKDGSQVTVGITTYPVKIKDKTMVLGIARDITERKHAEEALKRSEEKYRHLVENSNAVLYATDENGKMSYISPMIVPMAGYDPAEIIDRHFTEFIYHEDIDRIKHQFRILANGKSEPSEYRMLTKSRDICWIRTSSRPIFLNGRFLGVQGVMTDITDRKRAEEKLKASLREKEAIMREIHHRVKNNMQIVSSLLNLQARQLKDEKLQVLFKESQSRIKTMALVHESFYKSKDMNRIDISDYIKKMATHLMAFYGVETIQIQFNLDIMPIEIEIHRAIPCGLILNELITNSLKHAFAGKPDGKITVSLHTGESGKICLSVKDSGIGFPEKLDFRNTESLGMQIIMNLVDQLDGSIELRRDRGTEFIIQF
jgi:PAS domain S-box-containing protein